ncbi:hypothetical protein PACTADRAFT_1775 [Pachysolen tannophilus NRRL Y-2460]|uniref:Enoyl reductase (ER) domain-containing protein n=1 Tax=Pachysolen tannophilus NRRL Y-2460 TaxID=669874 RepID=A0A1E4TZN7_PACTA|nr:hypothetical protein PACTADRAFT_1775 [Pachysolen tannophilus NRRL Y-2460]
MSTIPEFQKAVLFHEPGGLDKLKYEEIPVPKDLADEEVLIANKYVGVNLFDSLLRSMEQLPSWYPATYPIIPGFEGSGIVVKVGKNVTKLKNGDKVVYAGSSTFTQYTKVNANSVLKLSNDAKDEKLAKYTALVSGGLTSLCLTNEAYELKKEDYVLLYGVGGGVGLVLTQLASKKGAHVIAVASSDEKLAAAKHYGAEFLINHKKEDILKRVKEITDNKGVQVVYDSVGKEVSDISFESLAVKGTWVIFGFASGPTPPVNPLLLFQKNAKLVSCTLYNTLTSPSAWEHYYDEFSHVVEKDGLEVPIEIFPIEEYSTAIAKLEGKKVVGKLLLEISS